MNAWNWFMIVFVILVAKDNLGYFYSTTYKKSTFFDWFYLFFFFGAAAFYAFVSPVSYFYALGFLIAGATQIFRVLKKP